jgi:hypothetical protein
VDPVFVKSKSVAETISGMLSPFSMAAMDSLLAFQQEQGIKGSAIEMGVYHGKSAALLLGRLSATETLHLYGIADYLDREALARSGTNFTFRQDSTMDLSIRDFKDHRRAIRFCNIDASHMFEPTFHEMRLADYVLSEDGILCLDDYTNLNYSQILAATFKYLFTTNTDLRMFVVTNEKAYLCRRSRFGLYGRFVLGSIQAQMAKRGIDDTVIARTDDTPSYGAFYLRPREHGEVGNHYGAELYHQFYQIRDYPLAGVPSAIRSRLRKVGIVRALAAKAGFGSQ